MLIFLVWLWLATTMGITSVPLETHEVFVLETARTMEVSGDWMVPRFNGEPRLNKPPLNYWLTAALSKCDPSSPEVQIWHGRMVSLLAGLLMALATLQIGTLLYNRETGFLAAVLLMGTQGFVHLSGSCRPDQLYASLGVLQVFGWIAAWRSRDRSWRQWACSLAGWTAAGLATLTKGPQIPVVFLLAWIAAFIGIPGERRRLLPVLRPVSGIVVFSLLCVPWWLVLHHRLALQSVNLSDSQLSGSLLLNLAGWRELLSLYYLRTMVAMLLPVVVAAPLLALRFRKIRSAFGRETRLLLVICVTMLVVFTLAGHYRKHYLQPILPFTVLLLARAFDLAAFSPLPKSVWKVAVGLLTAVGIACLGLIAYQRAYEVLWVLPVYVLLLVVFLKRAFASSGLKPSGIRTQVLMLASFLMVVVCVGNAYIPMSTWRKEEQVFAKNVGRSLGKTDRLAEWQVKLELLPFFCGRSVLRGLDLEGLKTAYAKETAGESFFVVVPGDKLADLNQVFKTQPLCQTHYTSKKKADMHCVRVIGVLPRP